MGCTSSSNSDAAAKGTPKGSESTRGVADDARSFRSKIGAIKMLTKNPKSRGAFMQYLEGDNKVELLICYRDLEEIKLLNEEQAFTRVTALIWRYKSMYEEAKINSGKPKSVEFILWDALGKLRTLDSNPVMHTELLKFITIAQNDILSRLIIPFEGFLNSQFYRDWQNSQIADEVHVRRQSQMQNRALESSAATAASTHCPSTGSVGSTKTNTFSVSHPEVLIVDDSTVTLKLTALTLQRDGHLVQRARNGQEALQLLKSRRYHIVLIDLNMPVMDGYETVRIFREYEQRQGANLLLQTPEDEKSDRLSSLSADSGDETAGNGSNTAASASPARSPSDMRRKNSSRGEYSGLSNRDAANQLLGSRHALTPEHYHQLIIGMSTNVDDVTKRKALAAGMDNFLPKPFTLQKFIESIRQAQRVVHEKTARASFSQRPDAAVPPNVLSTPNELFEC